MRKILFLGSNKGVFQMVSEANKLGYRLKTSYKK